MSVCPTVEFGQWAARHGRLRPNLAGTSMPLGKEGFMFFFFKKKKNFDRLYNWMTHIKDAEETILALGSSKWGLYI